LHFLRKVNAFYLVYFSDFSNYLSQ
jgi:hypothetical protein